MGYFVFADEEIVGMAEKYGRLLFAIGLAATFLNVYLFVWTDKDYILLNDITKYIAEWVMIIALLGVAKRYPNFTGIVSNFMRSRSFLFYIYHFIWVVLLQYLFYEICGNRTLVLFFGTIIAAYLMTFICCEISIRIPFLCLVTGTKNQ